MFLVFWEGKNREFAIPGSFIPDEVILEMKMKIFWLLLFSASQAFSQMKPVGIWEGKLSVAGGLTINIVLRDSSGILTGTLDSPDQGAYDIPVDSASFAGDSLFVSVKSARITYSGKLVNDSAIEGIFRQGVKLPLNLKKIAKLKKRGKPQTPEAPFNYEIKDVEFSNKKGDIRFAGTLTYPAVKKDAKEKFPAILLISGSGSQNRDEEILGHKPFWVIADYLTKKGFAVLRVDDRGTGKSTGDMSAATSADLAEDGDAAIEFLRSRPFVNTSKIGLAGHSEGGLIACRLAAKRKDLDFIILMAGPGIRGIELMAEQNIALLTANGIPRDAALQYGVLYRSMVREMISAPDSAAASERGKSAFESWLAATDSQTVKKLGFSEKGRRSIFLKAFGKQVYTPWMIHFMNADPSEFLSQLECKVLALNGEKDVQVVPGTNLEGIRKALEQNKKVKSFEVKEMPGLNHLFQTCEKCIPSEYGKLEETISPAVLDYINSWLEKNVKGK